MPPRIYCTEQDYRDAYEDQSRTASRAERWSASQLVDRATVGAVFTTYADGMPASPAVAEALKAATCAVLDYRRVGLVDAQTAAVVQQLRSAGLKSASIGGTSYTVTDQPAGAEVDLGALPQAAHDILADAGLVGGGVIVYG